VRDRATLYLSLLSDGPDAIQDDPQAFLSQGLDVPLANLEASLQSYVSEFYSPLASNYIFDLV